MLSLDVPTEDGNTNMYVAIPDTTPSTEDVISDAILQELLIAKYLELAPALKLLYNELSERKLVEQLGRRQRTFAEQMKKYRTKFRMMRGYQY